MRICQRINLELLEEAVWKFPYLAEPELLLKAENLKCIWNVWAVFQSEVGAGVCAQVCLSRDST